MSKSGGEPEPTKPWQLSRADGGRLLLVAGAYLAAHKLAYLVPDAKGVIAAIWPASGIALASLLLSPRRLWPALLVAILAANFTVEMFAGRNVWTELGFLAANLIEIGGSAWFVTRFSGPAVNFRRVNEVLALLGAALGVNAVSTAVGAAAAGTSWGGGFWVFYRTWWIGDGLALMLLTPLFVGWFRPTHESCVQRKGYFLELAGVLTAALVLVWFCFGPPIPHWSIQANSYMLFVPAIWAALRLGPRGCTGILALLGLLEIGITVAGRGSLPLGGADQQERLQRVQLFVGIQCVVSFLLAAAFAERRQGEESLQASEERLRALGDNLPDSMVYQVVREPDGTMRFLHVSAGVTHLNGVTPEAVLADPTCLYQCLHEEDRVAIAAAEEASLKTMSMFEVVARLRRPDGRYRWMHIRSQPRRLPDGRVAWDGIQTDITEHREMQEALRLSEEKFSKVFLASPVAIVVSRLSDGRLLEVNAALEQMSGYPREELLGRTIKELGLWQNLADRDRMAAELSQHGQVNNWELNFQTRDHRTITTQYSAALIEVEGDRWILAALADITARKQARDELRRLNRALQTITRCNEVIVRTSDENTLLHRLCRVIVNEGEHVLAWVGYSDPGQTPGLRMMAFAGEQQGYLESVEASWRDPVGGRGLVGVAIGTGQPAVCRDFLTDPRVAPWRELGQQNGFRSAVALPLRFGKEIFGVLSIYSRAPQAFDRDDEIQLLTELTDDLAIGLRALREQRRKEEAEREVRRLLAEAESSRGALLSILEDQKRSAEALQASEEQFRSAMEHSPIGKAIVSLDGRWLEVNQALCRITGYSREEILARDFQSITHPEDLPKDLIGVRKLLARELGNYVVEKRYVHRDGHAVWIQLHVSLLWNADGTPRHFIAQIQDISQRRRAETERLQLVRDLGERVKELTTLHRAARLLQQERPFDRELLDELVALLPPAWRHPEICVAQVSYGGLTVSSGGWTETPWMQEATFYTRNGQVGVIRVAYLEERSTAAEGPFLAEERTLLQSLADMLMAHLERMSAENALRAVNRRYARHEAALSLLSRSYALKPEDWGGVLREIVEVVARALEVERVSVWFYNDRRTAIRCIELFERSVERHGQGIELLREGHEPYFQALDGSDLIAAANAVTDPRTASLASYLASTDVAALLDAPLHSRGRSTGVLCCEHVSVTRVWTPDEQTFTVAVANLLSMLFAQLEQQKLEAQLRQAQKLESLGTLAGGIAHDFNNILGAIISFTELARMDHPDDGELQDNLGEVLKASGRAVGLVRQILAFSRRQPQERKPMQLAPVVREALQLMRSTLPATVEIQADLADPLPAISADATQMHQVVMNLCTNAGHAMRGRPGILRVVLEQIFDSAPRSETNGSTVAGEFLHLTISDTGHGMDAATLQRIFDPFFTTKGPGEGTGLGLAVVHGIIQEHGGEIRVESEPGVGTSFHVLLPVVEAEAGIVQPAGPAFAAGLGRRILFVDDEVALAEAARRLLGRHGFQVEIRYRPEEALALLERDPRRFDAVLTDLTMPTMSGLELAQRILRLQPRLPVILMSGHAGELTVKTVKSQGLADLVVKPLDYPALAHRIAEAIVRREFEGRVGSSSA